MVFASLLLLAGCRDTAPGKINHYRLHGTVKRLQPDNKVALIQHETIRDEQGKVWMEAMTMEFPVRDPVDFAKMAVGKHVEARVNQRESDFDYWLDEVKVGGKGGAPNRSDK